MVYNAILGTSQLTIVRLIIHDNHATVPQAIPGWRVSSRDLHTLHILRHRCAHVDSLRNTHYNIACTGHILSVLTCDGCGASRSLSGICSYVVP